MLISLMSLLGCSSSSQKETTAMIAKNRASIINAANSADGFVKSYATNTDIYIEFISPVDVKADMKSLLVKVTDSYCSSSDIIRVMKSGVSYHLKIWDPQMKSSYSSVASFQLCGKRS